MFNVIGGLNNGWRVAMTTLNDERGGNASVLHIAYQRNFWKLARTARKRGRNTDALTRQKLAWAYSQVELVRFAGLRRWPISRRGAGRDRKRPSTSCSGASTSSGSARSPWTSRAPTG